MYDSETMIFKERCRIRQKTSEDCWVLGGWIVPNARIRELCRVMKLAEERIDSVLQRFGHVERMENTYAKRVPVGECARRRSVGTPRKRWTDTVKDCLKKKVWMSLKQGEWCMIGLYGGGL